MDAEGTLYESEYGWEMAREDGTMVRGELLVGEDGVVLFRPNGTVIQPLPDPVHEAARDLLLYEPGRKGHAAAMGRLRAALSAERVPNGEGS